MLQRLNIRSKLLLTVAVPIVLLLGVGAFAFPTFQKVKVNGPQYKKIAALSDLRADVLPPPEFLVEAQQVAGQILNTLGRTTKVEQFNDAKQKLASLEHQYRERHAYWDKQLRDNDLRKSLLVDSYLAGNAYWKTMDTQFLPLLDRAIQKGYVYGATAGSPGHTEFLAVQGLYENFLTRQYEQHRTAIDQVVTQSEAKLSKKESDVTSEISKSLLLLALIGSGALVAAGLLGGGVARSISRPVRRLTDAANFAATEQLPRVVAEVQATGVASVPEPVAVVGNDELGELAVSFNAMQSTAVALAADQARLRRNVSENLVNLGRRNQVLLGRTLNFVTQLEESERDPKRLDDLFRLDHLATRMRRNAESLLVLAGSEPPRMWSEPVEIGDVIRAALSEIEDYHRVDLTSLESGRITGTAVSDISHLLAELLENATSFSPPTSKVSVLGKRRSDGYLVVIVDEGFGMTRDELDSANARINSPSSFETTPSKVLGLQVVGKLAERHGVRVELTESFAVGVAARVLLPESLFDNAVHPRSEAPPAISAPAAPAVPSRSTDAVDHDSATNWTPDTQAAATPDWITAGASSDSTRSSYDHTSSADGLGDDALVSSMVDAIDDDATTPDWMTELTNSQPNPTPAMPVARPAAAGSLGPVRLGAAPLATRRRDARLDGTDADRHAHDDAATAPPREDQTVEVVAPAPTTPGGLRRRTPGAQLPDTGPTNIVSDEPARDPSAVRNMLGGLQRSLEGARRANDES